MLSLQVTPYFRQTPFEEVFLQLDVIADSGRLGGTTRDHPSLVPQDYHSKYRTNGISNRQQIVAESRKLFQPEHTLDVCIGVEILLSVLFVGRQNCSEDRIQSIPLNRIGKFCKDIGDKGCLTFGNNFRSHPLRTSTDNSPPGISAGQGSSVQQLGQFRVGVGSHLFVKHKANVSSRLASKGRLRLCFTLGSDSCLQVSSWHPETCDGRHVNDFWMGGCIQQGLQFLSEQKVGKVVYYKSTRATKHGSDKPATKPADYVHGICHDLPPNVQS